MDGKEEKATQAKNKNSLAIIILILIIILALFFIIKQALPEKAPPIPVPPPTEPSAE